MRGGGGAAGRGLSQLVQLYTGAQINFADLTPYLTYVCGYQVIVRFKAELGVVLFIFSNEIKNSVRGFMTNFCPLRYSYRLRDGRVEPI
jgi:hypothetical protein